MPYFQALMLVCSPAAFASKVYRNMAGRLFHDSGDVGTASNDYYFHRQPFTRRGWGQAIVAPTRKIGFMSMHCSNLIGIFLDRLHGHGKCTIAEAIQDAKAKGVLVSHSIGEEYDDDSYGQWFEMVVGMLDARGVVTADDCPILQTWRAGEYLPASGEYDLNIAEQAAQYAVQLAALHAVEWRLVNPSETCYELPTEFSGFAGWHGEQTFKASAERAQAKMQGDPALANGRWRRRGTR